MGLDLRGTKATDHILKVREELLGQHDNPCNKEYLITHEQLGKALNVISNLPYRICANVINILNSIPELEDYCLIEDVKVIEAKDTKAFLSMTKKDEFIIEAHEIQKIVNLLGELPEEKAMEGIRLMNSLEGA